jgi:hypothetical protein
MLNDEAPHYEVRQLRLLALASVPFHELDAEYTQNSPTSWRIAPHDPVRCVSRTAPGS